MNQLPILIPLPLLLVALAVPVAGRLWRHGSLVLALGAIAASTAYSGWALATVLSEGPLVYHLGGWAPPVGIEFVVDNVSAFVALIVTSVSLVTVTATRRWAEREVGDRLPMFYALVLLLLTGLTGIVVTGDLFNLFVFLEIASLAAYALVFIGGPAGMIAGFRYLILGSIGGAFYLLGVGFIYFATGTLNMADAQHLLVDTEFPRAAQTGAVFIFAGLGLKMALVPLHLWLPDAYTHAPSSVNTLIAPVMTKVGAYAMLRMFMSVFPDGYLKDVVPVADALLILGLIGIVFGPVAAMAQRDIRRVLAYSSVGQLALIAVGLGIATPLAFVAALLHLMNHAVMKATLFVTAASIRMSTGLTQVDDFRGMGRRMPLTMAAFTMGAIAMVGIPPAAGFFSKWYMVQAGVDERIWVVPVIVLASSLLSAAYLFRVLERAYLHPVPRYGVPEEAQGAPAGAAPDADDAENRREAPWDMVAAGLLLGGAAIALGVINTLIVEHVLEPAF